MARSGHRALRHGELDARGQGADQAGPFVAANKLGSGDPSLGRLDWPPNELTPIGGAMTQVQRAPCRAIVRLKRASHRVGEAQWWPHELDAVGETDLGQHRRVRVRSEVLEKSL